MSFANYSVHHNLILASVAGNYAAGTVLVQTTAGDFVIATSANRTAYNRNSAGIMRTAGDGTRNRAVDVQFCGLIPASIAGVGTGTQGQWVRVSSAGLLERVTSPGVGDDVVGKADADGTVECLFGGLVNTTSGTPPGGSTGEVQYNNAGAFGGATNVKAGSGYVSIGTNPAASGGLRLANNTSIKARNAANSGDVTIASVDASDVVILGGSVNIGSNYVQLASGFPLFVDNGAVNIGTTPATSGAIRLVNNVTIKARNAANSGNIDLLATDASNNVIVGSSSFATQVVGGANSYVALGAGPATGGQLRLSGAVSTDFLKIRFSGVDYAFLSTDASNNFQWGNSTFNAYLYGYATQVWSLTDPLTLYGQSTLKMTLSTAGIQFGAGSADFGGGSGAVLGIDNAGTDPSTNPTGGGILYASGGAGKWRGSGGTVTTFGPAEPHCPRCGTDVGISQSENDLFGEELVHCHACEIRTGNGVVRHVADFFERRKAA